MERSDSLPSHTLGPGTDGCFSIPPSSSSISLLSWVLLFYQKAEYRGRVHLRVDLHAPIPALVPDSSMHGVLVPSTHLFAEPLASVRGEISVEESVDLNPLADVTITKVLARVMLELARRCERVPTETFDQAVQPIIEDVLKGI